MPSLIEDWETRAACARSLTDYWHPDEDATAARRSASFAVARQWCLRCPVQTECARKGIVLLNEGSVEGMYGGMTPPELRELARKIGRSSRKVAAHGSRTCYVNNFCRRPECKAANARYEADRRRGTGEPAMRAEADWRPLLAPLPRMPVRMPGRLRLAA